MTQCAYETIEAIVSSCSCSHTLLFKLFIRALPWVHGVNSPNCAVHVKCERLLTAQKQLFAHFFVLLLFVCFWKKCLKWLRVSGIAVLWGVLEGPSSVIKCPQASCHQRLQLVRPERESLSFPPALLVVVPGRWSSTELDPNSCFLLSAPLLFSSSRWGNFLTAPTHWGSYMSTR